MTYPMILTRINDGPSVDMQPLEMSGGAPMAGKLGIAMIGPWRGWLFRRTRDAWVSWRPASVGEFAEAGHV